MGKLNLAIQGTDSINTMKSRARKNSHSCSFFIKQKYAATINNVTTKALATGNDKMLCKSPCFEWPVFQDSRLPQGC